jgi:hypothetical protein
MGVTIRNVPLPIKALPETVAEPEKQPTDIGAHAASASSGDTPDLDLPLPIQVGDVPNTTFIAYANITTVAPPLSASDTPVPPDVPVRTLDSSLEASAASTVAAPVVETPPIPVPGTITPPVSDPKIPLPDDITPPPTNPGPSAASTVAAPVVEEALPITFFEATPPPALTDPPALAPFQPESPTPSPPNNASPTTGYYTEVHATGEGGELPPPPSPPPSLVALAPPPPAPQPTVLPVANKATLSKIEEKIKSLPANGEGDFQLSDNVELSLGRRPTLNVKPTSSILDVKGPVALVRIELTDDGKVDFMTYTTHPGNAVNIPLLTPVPGAGDQSGLISGQITTRIQVVTKLEEQRKILEQLAPLFEQAGIGFEDPSQ